MIKGPVSYAHASFQNRTYRFFGDHHERNTNCDGKKMIDYIKSLGKVHVFLETIFVPNPSDDDYKIINILNKMIHSRNISSLIEILPWFWEQKRIYPDFFHPLDIRRQTKHYNGVLFNKSDLYLPLNDPNELFNYYIYNIGLFKKESYIQNFIQKARTTSYCSDKIDLYLQEEWNKLYLNNDSWYNVNRKDNNARFYVVEFPALIMDAYALYKMFQPEYTNVVCYVGHIHWSRYKRFLDYIKVPTKISLDIAGCVNTKLKF